jgi:hypothetical protein
MVEPIRRCWSSNREGGYLRGLPVAAATDEASLREARFFLCLPRVSKA